MLSPSKNMKEGSFLIRKGDQTAAAISCSFERKKCLTKEAYLATLDFKTLEHRQVTEWSGSLSDRFNRTCQRCYPRYLT